jgi:putative endopeptidase
MMRSRNVGRPVAAALIGMLLAAPAAFGQATDVTHVAKRWKADHGTFNPAVMPCDDFYEHVCGGWAVPGNIPADKPNAQWASSLAGEINDHLIDQLLAGDTPIDNSEVIRLRIFFSSCMSQDADSERAADETLRGWLDRINAVQTRDQLTAIMFDLQAHGVNAFFEYSGQPDRADRTRHRGEIRQRITGLWSGAYSDKGSGADGTLTAYRAHVARMLALTGISAADAAGQAMAVFSLESAMAAKALSYSDQFDPQKSEHPSVAAELREIAPGIDWTRYLKMVDAPAGRPLNISSPAYLHEVDALLTKTAIADLQAFLRWQLLLAYGPALPVRFVEENQSYTRRPDVQPPSRIEQCKLATIKALGVELSKQFSLRYVGPQVRSEATAVAEKVRSEIVRSADSIAWLSAAGKAASEERLRMLDLKVGYPDEWPATGDFTLNKKAFLANVINARTFEQKRSWARARAPRNRQSWEMMVYPNAAPGMAAARLMIPNGYPDVFTNSIVLTAAWLRPPLFDAGAPPEVRFGTFGTLVGHELGHVLENHEFDASGEMHETWTAADISAHEKQGACLIEQANAYSIPENIHLDGTQTIEENVADLSGVVHAYGAMAKDLGARISEVGEDGLTPAKRYFIAYAQQWCTAERPEYSRQNIREDGHAPNKFRVNGPLANMPAFARAFSCSGHTAMVRPAKSRCSLWGLAKD